MYAEREYTRYSNAEPSPTDWIQVVACILLVVGVMTMVLHGMKRRAESATPAEKRVMTEEVILP